MTIFCSSLARSPFLARALRASQAYEPRCYYFEVVECLRRLALTGLLVFAPDDDVTQVVLAAVVAMLAMAVYGGFAPFDKESDDRLCALARALSSARVGDEAQAPSRPLFSTPFSLCPPLLPPGSCSRSSSASCSSSSRCCS